MDNLSRMRRIASALRVSFLLIVALLLTAAFPEFPLGPPGKGAQAVRLTDQSAQGAAAFRAVGTVDAMGGTSSSAASALSPLPKRQQDMSVPESLKDFVRKAVDKLAGEAPFKEWKTAEQTIGPLGPGTHSWLVNFFSDDQRIGYMIITASDNGEYTLSEYGAGTDESLPYSVSELRRFLAQKGLIHSSDNIIEPFPLYAPLLPYWKVTLNGQTLYLNAIVPEILPWDKSKAEAVAGRAQSARPYGLLSSALPDSTVKPIFRSGQAGDPYDNLLWLTSPKLTRLTAGEFAKLLHREQGLVFRSSSGANDTVGAPLMISGYQLWTRPDAAGSIPIAYAASGMGGQRFLPLDALQQSGQFQVYISDDGQPASPRR
ncbi:hypothetical protein G5B47_18830 [Paenibacillus sp. 7124]|uniref:Uncharacterized protein n=1 Tax=Paenibacillus apii TaxID=1850370 RepID=A0A6M1PLW1_9BACL|nr:hypothetical protein [Paenibacillus apii]NGM84469.1 hypothetical protein [Paenibacillus apii]NJJ40414.1 hypothetical protein [Paenibacillus apii]